MKFLSSLRRVSIYTQSVIFIFLFSIIAVSGSVLSSIYTTQQAQESMKSLGEKVIVDELLIGFIVTTNSKLSLEISQSLERTASDVEFLADYLFETYTKFNPELSIWAEEEVIRKGPMGQYLNSKTNTSSVFVPNYVKMTPEIMDEIEKSRYLDLVFASIQTANPNIAAMYFASPNGMVRYYPNIDLGNVVRADFSAIERSWYIAAIQKSTPRPTVAWSSVYLDATGLGMVLTASRAVYDHGKLIGVVGIDLLIEDILAEKQQALQLRAGYNFLIDDNGYALAMPPQAYIDILGRKPAQEALTNVRNTRQEFLPTISEMRRGYKGVKVLKLGPKELIVAYSPVPSVNWSLGSVVESNPYVPSKEIEESLQANTQRLIFSQILPLSSAVLVILAFLGLIVTNLITTPIRTLAASAEKLSRNEWDVEIPQDAPGEIGLFAQTFRNMAKQLRDIIANLEEKVAERTEALRRRAIQLQASVEVGRAVTSERDLEKLLSMVTHLISERFGFYHVGIFLIDPKGEYAWLKAANSEGGQRMLQRQHRLKVNEQGIVGYVTGTGKARIALDVGEDAVFFNNPDLPFTRSEMALPLIAQGKLLGALDIQSEQGGAFTEEDIEVLSGMANLIAIAIQNAELFAETQAALEATRRAYREMSLRGWIDLINRSQHPAYLSTSLKKLTPLPQSTAPVVEKVRQTNAIQKGDDHELAIPIMVKGNRIGVLRLRRQAHQPPFTDTDIDLFQDIALRIGTALEAARLYQESQKRALREKLVGEITSKIRSSNEPKEILKIAIEELQKALQATKAQVAFFSSKSALSDNGHHEGLE